VVELFTRLNSSLHDLDLDGQDDSVADKFVDSTTVTDFIYRSRVTNVDVMPAGVLDESYQSRLAEIDWEGMYDRCPAIYRAFARRLSRDYAVVLVDSCTGLTDTSGICTALLPDKLIVVFTPNRQSLAGVETLIQRSTQYRQASKDLRSLLVYPLPSRIENQLEKLRSVTATALRK
jgi:MinD-like ATPase involved in chromosome partitioning or flagellar assembly